MSNFENVTVIAQPKKTWAQRNLPTFCKVAGIASAGVVATVPAHADVATLFTNAATELGGVETGVMAILAVLATVVAILIGWAYFKKTR